MLKLFVFANKNGYNKSLPAEAILWKEIINPKANDISIPENHLSKNASLIAHKDSPPNPKINLLHIINICAK